jgi:hypothetical protein
MRHHHGFPDNGFTKLCFDEFYGLVVPSYRLRRAQLKDIFKVGLYVDEIVRRALRVVAPTNLICSPQRDRTLLAQPGMVAEEFGSGWRRGARSTWSETFVETAWRGRGLAAGRQAGKISIEGDAAPWHDHVDVRMVGQCRAPCVEHGGDADARAKMARIGGCRLEQ